MKTCSFCQAPNHTKAFRCKYCDTKFPISAQQKEKTLEKIQSKNATSKVWDAAVMLFFIGGMVSIVGIWVILTAHHQNYITTLTWIPLLVGLLFIALGVWSNHRPFYALLCGTISYSILGLYLIFFTIIGTLFGSLIVVAIGIYLYIGLMNAKKKTKLNNREDILDA